MRRSSFLANCRTEIADDQGTRFLPRHVSPRGRRTATRHALRPRRYIFCVAHVGPTTGALPGPHCCRRHHAHLRRSRRTKECSCSPSESCGPTITYHLWHAHPERQVSPGGTSLSTGTTVSCTGEDLREMPPRPLAVSGPVSPGGFLARERRKETGVQIQTHGGGW